MADTTPTYKIIREKYQLGPAYHMTHFDNLEGILSNNSLKSFNLMHGVSYSSLANDDVQKGRASITIAITQRALHDYVPLYFGWKTPMVAVNQKFNENLLFLRFSLDKLMSKNTVISDGNARSLTTKFSMFTEPTNLEFLDRNAINTVKYAHDPEIKRKKQAEVLVPDSLTIDNLLDIICFSSDSQSRILDKMKSFKKSFSVIINNGWYFK